MCRKQSGKADITAGQFAGCPALNKTHVLEFIVSFLISSLFNRSTRLFCYVGVKESQGNVLGTTIPGALPKYVASIVHNKYN